MTYIEELRQGLEKALLTLRSSGSKKDAAEVVRLVEKLAEQAATPKRYGK